VMNKTQMARQMMMCYTNVVEKCGVRCDRTNAVCGRGKGDGYLGDQFGGHGEIGAAGMEVDGGIFDPTPFCDNVTPAKAGGNDGRGDIRDVGSFEGDILRDDGPLILQHMTDQHTSITAAARFKLTCDPEEQPAVVPFQFGGSQLGRGNPTLD